MSGSPVARVLESLHARIGAEPDTGTVADYIPELARADPATFGIALATVQGELHSVGDADVPFTIQSISKVIAFGLALEDRGPEGVAPVVGVEPSGEAFNSIRLHPERSTPLNPMVNAGAIATTGLVAGATPAERLDRILATMARYTGRPAEVDERVYRSERETGHRNRAIAHLLRNFGVIDGDPDEVLEVYFRQCSILVTCRDLAVTAATLANRGVNPLTGERAVAEAHVPSILSVMATCGMYDFAGQWLHDVGLPAKSGVAGGIMAVLPGQVGIGTLSPPLDAYGNSVRGIRVCRALSDELHLHLLDAPRHGPPEAPLPAAGASRRRRSAGAAEALEGAAGRLRRHRPRGDLTFATAAGLTETLLVACPAGGAIVLELDAVSRIDDAAATLLAGLGDGLAERGVRLLVTGAEGHARLGEELGRRAAAGAPAALELWLDPEEALERCEDEMLAGLGVGEDAAVAVGDSEPCRRMPPDEVAILTAAMEPVAFAAGELLLRTGDPSDHLLLIESGHASVVATTESGARVRVLTIGPGMFTGEMGLIDGDPRSADVVAEAPVRAHRLTRAALDALPDGVRTDLLMAVAESLSGHLRRATALLAGSRA